MDSNYITFMSYSNWVGISLKGSDIINSFSFESVVTRGCECMRASSSCRK